MYQGVSEVRLVKETTFLALGPMKRFSFHHEEEAKEYSCTEGYNSSPWKNRCPVLETKEEKC